LVKFTYRFLEVIFALFIVYLLITRGFLTWLQYAPEQFTSAVKSFIGVELSYESLALDQHWLGFEFEAKNVSLNSERFHFDAEKLSADINLFSFALPAAAVGDYLYVENASLEKRSSFVNSSESKLAQLSVSREDLHQKLLIPSTIRSLWKQVSIKDVRLTLQQEYPAGIHLKSFELAKSSRISLVSEFGMKYGEVLDYEPFSLTLNASQNSFGGIGDGRLNLVSYRPVKIQGLVSLLPEEWQAILPKGDVLVEAKANFQNSKLSKIEMNLNGSSFDWPQNDELLPNSAGAKLEWVLENDVLFVGQDDWHIQLLGLQLDQKYLESISPIELKVDDDFIDFNAKSLNIEPFKVITQALISDPKIANLFGKTAHLSIQNLSGKLNWQTLELKNLHFYLKELAVPLTDFPSLAIEELTFDKTGSEVILQTSKPVWLVDTRVHKDAIKIQPTSSIVIDWRSPTHWRVQPFHLAIDEFDLAINSARMNNSKISFDSSFESNRAKIVMEYLPYVWMGQPLQKWLKNSQIDGEALKARISIDAPFEEFLANGHGFEMSGVIKSAQLNFDSNWKSLQNFDVNFLLQEFGLNFTTAKVALNEELFAKQVSVAISDLREKDIAVEISGQAEGEIKSAVEYLQASPLVKTQKFNDFLSESLILTGESVFDIQSIWVPVSGYKEKVSQVDIAIELKQVGALIYDLPKISAIQGQIQIQRESVKGHLQGQTLNGPVDIKLDGDQASLGLEIAGEAVDQNELLFIDPVAWSANVDIPYQAELDISVLGRVNWHKSASGMPSPLSKNDLNAPLTVKGIVEENKLILNFQSESTGLAAIQVSDQSGKKTINGTVLLANQADHLSAWENFDGQFSDYLTIKGFIHQFSIDEWWKYSKQFQQSYLKESNDSSYVVNWGNSRLEIEKLSFDSYEFPKSQLSWQPREEELVFRLVGPKADIAIVKKADSSLNVQVGTIELNPNKSKKDISLICSESVVAQDIPEIYFSAKQLRFKDYWLKDLNFKLSPHSEGYLATGINGTLGESAGHISGAYSFRSDRAVSSLVLFLTSSKVQALTNYLGINKGFTGKEVKGKLQLSWQGDLACFDSQKLKGPVDFKVKDGVIEDVEPGLARLLGLLSVESIMRRLKLDLKDITTKGFVFDEINAKGEFDHQTVKLKSLNVNAPSAQVEVNGLLSLKNETFDMRAQVTPSLGSSIPTIAAAAGAVNPFAAIAVYTLMKVLPKVNEELVTFKYKISGPWKEPKLVPVTIQ